MSEKRFKLIDNPYDEYRSILVDSYTDRDLGCDGGEPEDNSFWRDWSWVPQELNKLEEQLAIYRNLLEDLSTTNPMLKEILAAEKTDWKNK